MRYSEIMVHVDPESNSRERVSIAAELARRAKASLIGIGAWVPGMGFATDVAVIDEEPVKHQTEELLALMAKAEQRFFDASKENEHVEWRGKLQRPLEHLTGEARSAGLVIIGTQASTELHCEALDTGAAILRMGRPVLVVPDGVTKLSARRVIIAWKDCREARRAVRDALPILQDADEVMVVEVEEAAIKEAAEKALDDVAGYLERHNVPIKAKVFLRREGTIASDLIAFALRENSDLLVAGAYGHSRLGEWMFGGVTRELLEQSPMCCLFAH